jgi:hypothetical protein
MGLALEAERARMQDTGDAEPGFPTKCAVASLYTGMLIGKALPLCIQQRI